MDFQTALVGGLYQRLVKNEVAVGLEQRVGNFFLVDRKLFRGWDVLHSNFGCFKNEVESSPRPQWKFTFLVSLWEKVLNEHCVGQAFGGATTVCNVINGEPVPSRTLGAYVVRRKLMAHGHTEAKHIKKWMGLGCWPFTADAAYATQPICETELSGKKM